MTAGERGPTASVLVVAADDGRLTRYRSALRVAEIAAQVTADADEAEASIGDAAPAVLVLDRGLHRMVLFRLFSLVREEAGETPTQVFFVGQGGDTGPDDHYVQGEPSPMEVVDRVAALLERSAAATSTAPPAGAEEAAQRPAEAPAGVAAPEAEGSASESNGVAAGAGVVADAAAEDASAPAEPRTDAPPTAADAPAAPAAPGRRLDVLLIRIGLVLLIIGALLIFIQSDAFPPTLTPGAGPAPTRRPTASPKPAGFVNWERAPMRVTLRADRARPKTVGLLPPRVSPVSGESRADLT